MKTIDDIYTELRQWGAWQRTIQRSRLSYSRMSFESDAIHCTGNVTPIYRDEESEMLDRIMALHLSKQARLILSFSFVEQYTNQDAALKLNLALTTYKAKRREVMAIIIGLEANNRLDRSTRVC